MIHHQLHNEKLVVFDFDDTIYAHSDHKAPNSCNIKDAPIFQLSDRSFLERALRSLISSGIHVGVASFGKKSVIIETMNSILYGSKNKEPNPYFNDRNVVTIPDLRREWKTSLNKISSTFKTYVQRFDGDIDKAFEAFLQKEKPEQNSKYFCLKFDGESKVKMIQLICDYYNSLSSGRENITLKDVRFFDDNKDNVEAAQQQGIMAHLVPKPGITEKWWRSQCEEINACEPYFGEYNNNRLSLTQSETKRLKAS